MVDRIYLGEDEPTFITRFMLNPDEGITNVD